LGACPHAVAEALAQATETQCRRDWMIELKEKKLFKLFDKRV